MSVSDNKVGRNHRTPVDWPTTVTTPAMSSQPGGRYGTQLPQRSSTLASPSELRRSPSATSINSDAHVDSRSMPGHSSSSAGHSHLSPQSSLAASAQFNWSQQWSTSSYSDDTHTHSNHNQYPIHQYSQQQQQQQQSPVSGSVCAECGNNVTGQFVRALGAVFHKDCFRCKACPYLSSVIVVILLYFGSLVKR